MENYKDPILNQPLTQPDEQSPINLNPQKSKVKPFIIGLIIVVLVVAVFFAIYYWSRLSNTKGVSLSVHLPETPIQAGIPFSITVEVDNQSNVELKNPELTISLPETLRFLNQSQETSLTNIKLDDIGVAQSQESRIELLAIGGKDSVQQLEVSISYVPGTLTSRFEKNTTTDIVAIDSALDMDITTPTQVLSGEPYQTTLKITNNANKTFYGVRLEYIYPEGFSLADSSEKASSNQSENQYSWQYAQIQPNETKEIILSGVYSGAQQSAFDVKVNLSVQYNNRSYTVSQKIAPVSVASPPLALLIYQTDKDPGEVLQASQTQHYILEYKNNTDISLKDVIITAKLVGNMFDLSTLRTNGVLENSDTIVFNASRFAELASLAPGANGQVDFTIRTRTSFPIINSGSKNFTAGVKGQIESPTVPPLVSSNSTIGYAEISNQIKGLVVLEATGFYLDPTANIINSGPIPPKVAQPTTYTIHWKIKNYSTDLTNVKVKAYLGPNVRYTHNAKSTTGILPEYNPRTQELTWDIIKIPATTGVISAPVEAIFQVELTPSISQVGKAVHLIENSTLTAQDQFVNQLLTSMDDFIETTLVDDPTITGTKGIVVN